jgi:N-acetylneuraminate lyase
MHGDGSLNLAPIGDYAQHLVANGVAGVFVAGTSGEGQSLSREERMALAEAWAKNPRRGKLELIIHVGHNSQSEAERLAAHAASIGADAITMHAPTWYSRQTLGDLIEFCASVAAAAPALRFYLYDIPVITGLHLSAAEFLRQASSRIPTLAGLKFTNVDCATGLECIHLQNGKFDVLWGYDETLLAGAALGASGAVGTTYNFAAPIYQRMLEAADAGDWPTARAEQARAIALVRICAHYSPLAAFKFAMSLAGIDCGPVRAPVANLSNDDKRHLRAQLLEGEFITSKPQPVAQ